MIHTEDVTYFAGKQPLKGFLAYNKSMAEPSPAVVIASDWKGLGEFAKDKAIILAKYGYLVFAADMYGDGLHVDSEEEAANLMKPLFFDRKLLRERITAAFNKVKSHPFCNPYRIAAIGFCFGGLVAIELLRSGADLRALVSFHGLYAEAMGDKPAKLEPNAKMRGAALLLQGYEDPLLPPSDVARFQKELNDASIDWQMHIFGKTAHAFTNPQALNPEHGLIFNPASSRRAWQMMHQFLEENFV